MYIEHSTLCTKMECMKLKSSITEGGGVTDVAVCVCVGGGGAGDKFLPPTSSPCSPAAFNTCSTCSSTWLTRNPLTSQQKVAIQ